MKELRKNFGIIALLVLVIISFLLIYLYRFHGGISSDHAIWSEFANIFNGILAPILAAINIYIFWYLTRVIDLNNEKRQQENEKNEERRQKEKIELEKAITLMEFRKSKIDEFEKAIPLDLLLPGIDLIEEDDKNMAIIRLTYNEEGIDGYPADSTLQDSEYVPKINRSDVDYSRKLTLAIVYLKVFSESKKLKIFELKDNEESDLYYYVNELQKNLQDYDNWYRTNNGDSEQIFLNILALRSYIVSKLQEITLVKTSLTAT